MTQESVAQFGQQDLRCWDMPMLAITLKLHGMDGLPVVDASVMLAMVSANTNASPR
jgi:choline dehydrogenase-like flavoprotein